MKVGDLIKLDKSRRKNGSKAGEIGLVLGFDSYNNPILIVGGGIYKFHYTQLGEIISQTGEYK